MLRIGIPGIVALIVLGLATAGRVQAQTATKAVTGQQTGPGGGDAARAAEVLATVTSHGQTSTVSRGDLVQLLNRYSPIPADDREVAYSRALELLVNFHLLNHYLTWQRVQVPEAKIDEQIERMKDQLKKEGQPDLATLLRQNGTSMEDVRKDFATKLRWSEFSKTKASDGALRKFLNENRDRFSGTQVRASHILLKSEPSAPKAEKDKVRQKLEAIRKEIVGGKTTFAAAANKYTEDPSNAGGAGGDLDYFTLDSGFVEEFADAAFKLKKGEVSEPVETPFGMHLIQVTDRREGRLPDFEKVKPYIAQSYSMQLEKEIVTEERKTAKIDLKPMPKDLFAAEPAAGAAPTGAAGAGGAAAPR